MSHGDSIPISNWKRKAQSRSVLLASRAEFQLISFITTGHRFSIKQWINESKAFVFFFVFNSSSSSLEFCVVDVNYLSSNNYLLQSYRGCRVIRSGSFLVPFCYPPEKSHSIFYHNSRTVIIITVNSLYLLIHWTLDLNSTPWLSIAILLLFYCLFLLFLFVTFKGSTFCCSPAIV